MASCIIFNLSDEKWMCCMFQWSYIGMLSLLEGNLFRWLAKKISFPGLYWIV